MSGGAGKVYFILYLAVVLELLIIIVERDEAEEHLVKKQKESMKIVESILSQLQSGSGTEGINTRPQDEITLPPPGVNIKDALGVELKSWRRYIVEVGVTDISNDLKKQEGEPDKDYHERLKKLVSLANVEDIEYQIFYSSSLDPDNAPLFPNNQEIIKKYSDFKDFKPDQTVDIGNGDFWTFLGSRRLALDQDATYNNLPLDNLTANAVKPVYPQEKMVINGPSYVPKNMPEDSVFYYSEEESLKDAQRGSSGEIKKRAFVVNFQPPDKAGWYKLRFTSRTNRILGIRGGVNPDQIDQDTKVNIGTVQLTVEALEKVKKELVSKLDKYPMPSEDILIKNHDLDEFDKQLQEAKAKAITDENATEVRGKIELYGYICKLLAPGQSAYFSQNRGSIEFNIRVVTPKPPIAEPVVSMAPYTADFDKLPAVLEFTISPYEGKGNNIVEGRITDPSGVTVARLTCQPLDQIAGSEVVTPPSNGGQEEWRGIADQDLAPGKYKIEITHKLHNKSKVETGDLEIFKTGLANTKDIENIMTYLSNYGARISINAQPNSGGKIKSNQFRIYLNTDVDQQRSPFEGLSMDEPYELSAAANNLSLEISWVQPYTNKEIDLYPKKSFEIKQKQPMVNTRKQNATANSDDGKKIKIIISDIQVQFPTIGTTAESKNKQPDIKLSAKNGKISIKGGTYEFTSDPQIERDDQDGYTNCRITTELTGTLERGNDRLEGSITLDLTATAVNPVNGKKSDPKVETLLVPVKISIERSRGGGRRPGGGGPPPGGGGAPPRR